MIDLTDGVGAAAVADGATELLTLLSDEKAELLASLLLDGTLVPGVSRRALIAALDIGEWAAGGTSVQLLRVHKGEGSAAALSAALLAGVAQRRRWRTPAAAFVATGLPKGKSKAKNTYSAVIDLIDEARREVVVVGYQITHGAADIVRALARASYRGVHVTIAARDLEVQTDAISLYWPTQTRGPELYTYVGPDPVSNRTLHAKLFVADRRRILATSANMTMNGLHGNVEMGIQCEGEVAAEALTAINDMIAAKYLRRLPSLR